MTTRKKRASRKPSARALRGRPAAPPRRGLPWGPGNDRSRVGVRELRQNLSVYLDRVKAGESLTVTEHGQVVAILMPASHTMTPIERLMAEGRAAPATRSPRDLQPPRSAPRGGRPGAEIVAAARRERVP